MQIAKMRSVVQDVLIGNQGTALTMAPELSTFLHLVGREEKTTSGSGGGFIGQDLPSQKGTGSVLMVHY